MDESLEDLKYPIGRFHAPESFVAGQQKGWIDVIEVLPSWLDVCIENLDEAQLHTPYRPGGWTVHQVIHHIADSHMNAFVRLKLALTEDNPVIKPYDEDAWVRTAEMDHVPVNVSITLLHALHRRWGTALRHLGDEGWQRTYFHPESGRSIPLWEMTAMYAWHSRHHMEHIRRLRTRMNW